jgi:hypothetical protein
MAHLYGIVPATICMFNCIIPMHCIQLNMYRRRYIWKHTIPSRVIHCRKQYEKRKNEQWIESESFECTSEGQYHTGVPYWRSYRTISAKSYTREGIVYFQMYRRLYILSCMQCIGMIQLNMQIVAVCKSDILQKQS